MLDIFPTPPLVMNTCPCCNGSGRIIVRRSWRTWRYRETLECPSCHIELEIACQNLSMFRWLGVHCAVAGFALLMTAKTAAFWENCFNTVAFMLVFSAMFAVEIGPPRVELSRRFRFSLGALMLVVLDVAAMGCALIAANLVPLVIASWVAVWFARRQDSSTQPLAN